MRGGQLADDSRRHTGHVRWLNENTRQRIRQRAQADLQRRQHLAAGVVRIVRKARGQIGQGGADFRGIAPGHDDDRVDARLHKHRGDVRHNWPAVPPGQQHFILAHPRGQPRRQYDRAIAFPPLRWGDRGGLAFSHISRCVGGGRGVRASSSPSHCAAWGARRCLAAIRRAPSTPDWRALSARR